MKRPVQWLLCQSALLMASAVPIAHAGPMGFKDSVMSMGDFSPDWQEAFANYAFSARDAIGLGGVSMRSDDGLRRRDVAEVNYTRRLARWNLPDAQANIWLVAGLGPVTGNDFSGSRTLFSPGIQGDYETTRIYLAANFRLYRAEGLNHDYASLRAGFSFFEVDYDETQPWFILEARRMNNLSDQTEITPMLRLIHNRYFVEFGVNQSGQGRFNFMYIF
jgi:hypothetical protein